MPTYEYECKKCSYHFEVFQAMSDDPVKKCPKCGKAVRRLIMGGAGVIFKGSGFYSTDNTSKSAGSQKGADKKDTKPASNSENTSAGENGKKTDKTDAKTA